jgi:multidrug efflux system outer membrane protein
MRLAYLAIPIFFLGCNLGSDFKKPLPKLPKAWYHWQVDVNEPAVTWWKKLEDKTLNELVQRGVCYNWDINSARESLKKARAITDAAKAALWPIIAGIGSASRQNLSENTPFIPVSTNFNFFNQSVIASWDVNIWEVIKLKDAAKANQQLTLELKRGVVVLVIAEIAKNYCLIRSLQTQRELLAIELDLASQNFKLVSLVFEQDIIGNKNVLETETLVLDIKARLRAIDSFEAEVYPSLSVLTSLWTHQLREILSLKKTEPKTSNLIISAGMPSTLICRRPDVRAAVENLKIAYAQIGAAQGAFFPKFDLFTAYGYLSTYWLQLFNNSNINSIWGGAFLFPIFNGGLLWANYKEKVARKTEAEAEYLNTVLQALAEVDAYVEIEKRSHNKFKELQALSKEKLDIVLHTQQVFKQQMVSQIDVNNSEINYLDDKCKSVQAEYDWLSSWIMLYKALGGGWQWDENKCVSATHRQ